MLSKKNINIVVLENDTYQNKNLMGYLDTLCDDSRFSHFSFEFKSFTDPDDCLDNIEDDVTIFISCYYFLHTESNDKITGEEVIEHVHKAAPNCRIILMSNVDEERVASLSEKGMCAYINKELNTNNRLGAILQEIFDEESRELPPRSNPVGDPLV